MNDIRELKEKIRDLKLLFVDDEKDVREGTGTFLKKFFDDVTVCSDGDEALNIFKQSGDFEVVISDILMPKMDGITMVKEIKNLIRISSLYFLQLQERVEIWMKLWVILFCKSLSLLKI